MSYILEALKKAEQRIQRRKTSEVPQIGGASETPEWEVRMVSPVRYRRFKPEPARAANPVHLPRRAGIAAAVLIMLIFVELGLVYELRTRMSSMNAEINRLKHQISETHARRSEMERERLSLAEQKESLKAELEHVGTDLDRTRVALKARNSKQKRQISQQKQASVAEHNEFPSSPSGAREPLRKDGASLGEERSTFISSAENATVRTYSIR